MENRVSSIRYDTFDAIFLTFEFCCALSSIVTYVPCLHTKLMSSFKSQGQLCMLSCSDVKKN